MAATTDLTADLTRLREARTPVLLDLTGVTFLDSTGVCALIRAALDGRRDGWDLTMIPPSGHPLTVLQVCGILDELPLVKPAVAG